MFRCPVCTDALIVDDRTYRCEHGHSFDRSRDGSVNLLAGPTARHRQGGDSAEMIAARRAFLDAGHYDPLRDTVLRDITANDAVLDIGCGEGHYTRPLADSSAAWRGGIDLSKPAITAAARRTRAIAYAVAPAHAVPVADRSINVAVVVFGPMVDDELARILGPGGRATVVVPGPRHLVELKRLLFEDVAEHPSSPSPLTTMPAPDIERITYPMPLDHDDLVALWTMTPYRWQVGREREVVLPARAEVTADFLVCRYRVR